MPNVITAPDAIPYDRLTEILRRSHEAWPGYVSAIRVAFTKTLPFSRVARLEIEYSDKCGWPLPDHLFLKLSTLNAHQSDLARTENSFYASVGSEMGGPPLVRCYDSAFSALTGRCHLLLEDLFDTHIQTDRGKHPSLLHSELAVKCLARFHAFWWDNPKIGSDIGTVFDRFWLDTFLISLESSVAKFVDRPDTGLTREQRKAYERLIRASRMIWGRLTDASGLTVTHGDMHWWNFLHPKDPGKDETRIFDWQLWHIDLGPRDLAFLIALGGFADRKPELELHLVRCYYQTLIDNGVQNYPWSQFWEDYRWCAIRNLNIPVIFWTQGKHASTWQNALDRAFQSYNELKCGELI